MHTSARTPHQIAAPLSNPVGGDNNFLPKQKKLAKIPPHFKKSVFELVLLENTRLS